MPPTHQCQPRSPIDDASADAAVSLLAVRTQLRLPAGSVENEHETALDTFRNVPCGDVVRTYPYFGNLTKQALVRYQNAFRTQILTPVGLSQGTGFFGPSTIKHINNL